MNSQTAERNIERFLDKLSISWVEEALETSGYLAKEKPEGAGRFARADYVVRDENLPACVELMERHIAEATATRRFSEGVDAEGLYAVIQQGLEELAQQSAKAKQAEREQKNAIFRRSINTLGNFQHPVTIFGLLLGVFVGVHDALANIEVGDSLLERIAEGAPPGIASAAVMGVALPVLGLAANYFYKIGKVKTGIHEQYAAFKASVKEKLLAAE